MSAINIPIIAFRPIARIFDQAAGPDGILIHITMDSDLDEILAFLIGAGILTRFEAPRQTEWVNLTLTQLGHDIHDMLQSTGRVTQITQLALAD